MKYALNLAEDGRVLSACVVLPDGNYEDMPIVDAFPEGDLYEYRYEAEVFIHDPLPAAPDPGPTAQEDTDAMLVDHEYRLTLLELGLSE